MTSTAWTYTFLGFMILFGLLLIKMRFWHNFEVTYIGGIIILMSVIGVLGQSGKKEWAGIAMAFTALMCVVWIISAIIESPHIKELEGKPRPPEPDDHS